MQKRKAALQRLARNTKTLARKVARERTRPSRWYRFLARTIAI